MRLYPWQDGWQVASVKVRLQRSFTADWVHPNNTERACRGWESMIGTSLILLYQLKFNHSFVQLWTYFTLLECGWPQYVNTWRTEAPDKKRTTRANSIFCASIHNGEFFFVAAQQLNPVRQYCTRPRMPPRMFEDLYDAQAFIMETAARASTKVLPTTAAIAWRLSSPNNHYNNSSIYLVESDCIECGLRGFFCTFRPRLRESFANYICCEYSVQAAFPWTE